MIHEVINELDALSLCGRWCSGLHGHDGESVASASLVRQDRKAEKKVGQLRPPGGLRVGYESLLQTNGYLESRSYVMNKFSSRKCRILCKLRR